MQTKSSSILFIPNIIGYVRLVSLFISIFLNGYLFILCYSFSVGLDYFDGKAARMLNQVSILGGVLDMMVDRVSTAVLAMKTIHVDSYMHTFMIIYIFLDFLSHMFYFVSMTYVKMHHKTHQNLILRFYYNPTVLKIACCGSELWFIVMYLRASGVYKVPVHIMSILLGITAFKSFVNIFHLQIGISNLSVQQ